MDNNLIPFSTINLIAQEREKMLNGVVKLIGRMSESVVSEMGGEEPAVVEQLPAENGNENVASLIDKAVERTLDTQLKSLLHDVDYRISVLQDLLNRAEVGPTEGRVVSSDLNLAQHVLDGYVFTDNTPTAGSISWSGCHIVYKGTDYTITDGNTDSKYVWWDYSAVPNTVFQTSATKPTLTADDIIVAINEGGMARVVMTPGKMLPGGVLLDGAVSESELASGAVTNAKLAALAVLEGNIGSGAVTNTKLGSGAVDSGKLATGAVVAGKLADGAIDASTRFASGVVNSTALGTGAVTAGKLANGAIDTSARFAAGVVDANALGTGAVTTTKIGDGQVTGPKIGAGQVAENKLNIAQHLIYLLPFGVLTGAVATFLTYIL